MYIQYETVDPAYKHQMCHFAALREFMFPGIVKNTQSVNNTTKRQRKPCNTMMAKPTNKDVKPEKRF